MAVRSKSQDLTGQAKFVFQGTVQKMKSVAFKEVPVSDRTVVVRVDQLIHAPEVLRDYVGRDVTVQLAPGEKVAKGETLIFYTNGWTFGEGLALQSVGHKEATPSTVSALALHPGDPVASLHAREALAQAADADLIVSGRVSAVRLPPEEATARAAAMTSGRTTDRISEHAPLWQEAVIDIDEVHKGSHPEKHVVVKFPSSTDVRWHNAPKFHAGQEGVFLLHKGQVAARAIRAAGAAAAAPAQGYTALHFEDFQPFDELPRIKLATEARSRKRPR